MLRDRLSSLKEGIRSAKMPDAPEWQKKIIYRVSPYTMAGRARTLSTITAVQYVVEAGIEGAIVECGVWRGGQMMAAALTLQAMKAEREIVLFDTFAGMTAPGTRDVDHSGAAAGPVYEASSRRHAGDRWCEATLEDVAKNLCSTGYAPSLVRFVKGNVQDTIPDQAPRAIAYLRLDTDWYESTAHELKHLYPRLSRLGVLAIDDYGHWQGARAAVDEYVRDMGMRVLMHRIDYSARQFVKV